MNANSSAVYQRSKLALIPVLALVLLAILLRPSHNASTTSDAAQITSGATPQTITVLNVRAWPATTWRDVAAVNLFDPPTPPKSQINQSNSPADPTSDRSPATSHTPRVQAIFQDAHGAVAIVDSKLVRVGDVLDGQLVAQISNGGLTLVNAAAGNVRSSVDSTTPK